MLVITNRILDQSFAQTGIGGGDAFGEQLNAAGPNEIRLANVTMQDGQWRVNLVEEPPVLTEENLPSRRQFKAVLDRCKKEGKNCLFYVHGYNKPFEETLEQAWRLQERYGVEVVLFSWPSNTGGFPIKEYKHVKRVARASAGALDSGFEKLAEYVRMPFNRDALLECGISLNLIVYSMGNFLFKSYIESAMHDDESNMFTNIILCQADCDNEGHEKWVDVIRAGKRIYITINEGDKILGWSDANFQKDRLGRTVRNLVSRIACYIDITEGDNVGNTHQIWGKETNATVEEFFRRVLNGMRGENTPGLSYDSRVNAYRMA